MIEALKASENTYQPQDDLGRLSKSRNYVKHKRHQYENTHFSYKEAVTFIINNLNSPFNHTNLKRLLIEGEIDSIKFGCFWFISKSDLNRYCRSLSKKNKGEASMKEKYSLFLKVSNKNHKVVRKLNH